jgi:hypothetical protein
MQLMQINFNNIFEVKLVLNGKFVFKLSLPVYI